MKIVQTTIKNIRPGDVIKAESIIMIVATKFNERGYVNVTFLKQNRIKTEWNYHSDLIIDRIETK